MHGNNLNKPVCRIEYQRVHTGFYYLSWQMLQCRLNQVRRQFPSRVSHHVQPMQVRYPAPFLGYRTWWVFIFAKRYEVQNGTLPVSFSQSGTPSEYRSDRDIDSHSRECSGLVDSGVPANPPATEISDSEVESPTVFASPRSKSLLSSQRSFCQARYGADHEDHPAKRQTTIKIDRNFVRR